MKSTAHIKDLKRFYPVLFLTIFILTLSHTSQANSKNLFNSFNSQSFNHSTNTNDFTAYDSVDDIDSEESLDDYSENSELNQSYLKRAFESFIKSLLKKDIELEKVSFDDQTTSFLEDPTSFKAHVRVSPVDIIDPSNSYAAKTKKIWVKPYLRDVFFQTRSMVCKYSYRSKYRKARKSLSGHFIHENHSSLLCKDIENGQRARPFVFGSKKLIFIAELIPQKFNYNSSQITSFKVNQSKRNKTFY